MPRIRHEEGCVVSSAEMISQRLESELHSMPEWHSVCALHLNALVEGPEHATESLLRLLEPSLRTPAIWQGAPLELPNGECGALVVRNVAELNADEQAALSTWLEADGRQVVSTSAHPLFPLVARGLFGEALYYRLNVILVCIDSTGASV
jgi:hypothetical protein